MYGAHRHVSGRHSPADANADAREGSIRGISLKQFVMASPGTDVDLDDEDAAMHAQLLGSADSVSSAASDPEVSRIQFSGAHAGEDSGSGPDEVRITNAKHEDDGATNGHGHGHRHGHGHARGAGWRCESLDYDMFESRVNQDFAIDQL